MEDDDHDHEADHATVRPAPGCFFLSVRGLLVRGSAASGLLCGPCFLLCIVLLLCVHACPFLSLPLTPYLSEKNSSNTGGRRRDEEAFRGGASELRPGPS